MELKVNGMMCAHCEARVKDALTNLGLTNVVADHEKGIVSFDDSSVNLEDIKNTILDLGFEL